MAEHDTTEVTKAFYIGKRMVGKMPRHSMTDGQGSWHYPKAKDASFYGAVIGREYRMEEGKLPRPWHTAETGVVSDLADSWQAQHRDTLELKKASTKEIAPEVSQAVEVLVEACRGMTGPQRTRFLSYLIERFTSWRR